MFVDEKKQGEPQTAEQANRKLKLSEAIRIGATKLKENQSWLNGDGCGCAVAMAAVAFGADPMRHQPWRKTLALVSERTGHSADYLQTDVEQKHCNGMPALEIADWLETQGL